MKSALEQISNRCRHFTGLMEDVCKAGVAYATVKGLPVPGRGFALPCLRDSEDGAPACPKRSFLTAAETKAEIAESHRRFEQYMTARKAIVDHLGGPWRRGTPGVSGTIPCPICRTGSLRFSRAGVNGRVHAGCTTTGCVSWME